MWTKSHRNRRAVYTLHVQSVSRRNTPLWPCQFGHRDVLFHESLLDRTSVLPTQAGKGIPPKLTLSVQSTTGVLRPPDTMLVCRVLRGDCLLISSRHGVLCPTRWYCPRHPSLGSNLNVHITLPSAETLPKGSPSVWSRRYPHAPGHRSSERWVGWYKTLSAFMPSKELLVQRLISRPMDRYIWTEILGLL